MISQGEISNSNDFDKLHFEMIDFRKQPNNKTSKIPAVLFPKRKRRIRNSILHRKNKNIFNKLFEPSKRGIYFFSEKVLQCLIRIITVIRRILQNNFQPRVSPKGNYSSSFAADRFQILKFRTNIFNSINPKRASKLDYLLNFIPEEESYEKGKFLNCQLRLCNELNLDGNLLSPSA